MTDRRPFPFEGRWLWHNADHPLVRGGRLARDDIEYPDHLPGFLFGELHDFTTKPESVTRMVKGYPTRAAAVQALADARQRLEDSAGGRPDAIS